MNSQEQNTLVVLASFTPKADKVEELKHALRNLLTPTHSEEGCLQYDLHQTIEDSAAFFLYERWTSKNALDKHLQQPYIRDFFTKSENLLAEPVSIKTAHFVEGE